ncbi:MAG: hypothetical protein AAF805_06350, partial [Planctomycetota bacterium]
WRPVAEETGRIEPTVSEPIVPVLVESRDVAVLPPGGIDPAYVEHREGKREFYELYVELTAADRAPRPTDLAYLTDVVADLFASDPGMSAEELSDRLLNERLAAVGSLGGDVGSLEVTSGAEASSAAAGFEWLAIDPGWSVDFTTLGAVLAAPNANESPTGVPSVNLDRPASPESRDAESANDANQFAATRETVTRGERDRAAGVTIAGHPSPSTRPPSERPWAAARSAATVVDRASIDTGRGLIDLAALLRVESEPLAEAAGAALSARDAAFALESWRRATPIRSLGPVAPRDGVGPNAPIYTDAAPAAEPLSAETDPTTADRRSPPSGVTGWLATAFLGGAVWATRSRRRRTQHDSFGCDDRRA